jgi:LDH2 family malate/lactate/ureidoglycolate dehydrogenase
MSHADSFTEVMNLSAAEIEDLSRAALLNHNFDLPNVKSITNTVVACEMHGSPGHGLIRIPNYIRGAASGRIDPRATPIVQISSPSQVIVDGQNGYAALAIDVAREAIIQKASENGVVVASFRNTHHMHALWWDLEPFAENGLVAIEVVSTRQAVATYNSARPVLGTNPLGASFPRSSGAPITIDMATSKVSRGDIRRAAYSQTPIPLDWGLDETGTPTTDATRVFPNGAQLPFSTHPKASNIALFVELFAAVLSGDRFAFEAAKDPINDDGPLRTGTGILVVNPTRLGMPDFSERAEKFSEYMLNMGCERLPGVRRHELLARNKMTGVDVPAALVKELRELSGSAN